MTTHKPPPWFEALVNALDRAAFDAAVREVEPPKRGRPSKAALDRDSAYAEYLERIKNGSPPPGGWPLVQVELSKRVPKKRDVGRPYDVDPSAPFENQFEDKPVERFVANAACLLRIKKNTHRKQSGEKYVASDVTDDLLEEILPELMTEFKRIGRRFDDEPLRTKFLGELERLDQRLSDKVERLNLKLTILDREKNLDQRIRDRKRDIGRVKALQKKRKVGE